MKIADPTSALQWATSRCARQECCRQDIEKKLRDTPLSEEEREEVLERLENDGFIDHKRYARAFVHDKLEYDRWGRLKMAQALRLKGIDRHDIDEAFEEVIDEDHYREILKRVLESKQRTLRFDASDTRAAYAAAQKLVRFAASRGFESHLIFDAVDDLEVPDDDV